MSDFQTTIAAAVEEQAVTTAEIGRSVAHTAAGGREIATSVATVAESAGLRARVAPPTPGSPPRRCSGCPRSCSCSWTGSATPPELPYAALP